MRRIFLLPFLITVGSTLAGSALARSTEAVRATCVVAVSDVTPYVADYPLFQTLEADEGFQQDFHKYFRWLASFGDADPIYVQNFIDKGIKTLEARAVIFHEVVEFKGWLELGFKLADMMDLKYYQAHYPTVYPIAHPKAVREELNLVELYASRRGFPKIPQLAFALTMPVFEQRPGITIEKLMKRIDYPQLKDILDQKKRLTRADIEQATCVYTDGGYAYRNREGVVQAVMEYLSEGSEVQLSGNTESFKNE